MPNKFFDLGAVLRKTPELPLTDKRKRCCHAAELLDHLIANVLVRNVLLRKAEALFREKISQCMTVMSFRRCVNNNRVVHAHLLQSYRVLHFFNYTMCDDTGKQVMFYVKLITRRREKKEAAEGG